jgi:hypothetical protein
VAVSAVAGEMESPHYNEYMATATTSFDSEILARVVLPDAPTMSPAIATEILKLSFSNQDRQRMSELAAKAREGELTDEEIALTESYERVSSFLGFLKSKARISLKNSPAE